MHSSELVCFHSWTLCFNHPSINHRTPHPTPPSALSPHLPAPGRQCEALGKGTVWTEPSPLCSALKVAAPQTQHLPDKTWGGGTLLLERCTTACVRVSDHWIQRGTEAQDTRLGNAKGRGGGGEPVGSPERSRRKANPTVSRRPQNRTRRRAVRRPALPGSGTASEVVRGTARPPCVRG